MHTKITNITFGTDPEVFLINKITKQPTPAVGIIPGTKDKPFPISKKGHAIQRDNVMAEFCVPPTDNAKQLYKDIKFCLDYLNDNYKGTETSIQASTFFTDEQLQSDEAQEFGCDPDFCAWTRSMNKVGKANPLLRSAGGHLHIGYKNPDDETSEMIIRLLDLYLGIPSIILDNDTERRKLYGKAGAFRFKEYGVEYRTLSNFWIQSPELVEWIVNNANEAIKSFNSGIRLSLLDNKNIVECINNQDKHLANKLIKEFNITIPIVTHNKLIEA